MQEGIVLDDCNGSFASCEWLFPERKAPSILVSLRVKKFLIPGRWKSLCPATDLFEGGSNHPRGLSSALPPSLQVVGSIMTDSEKTSGGRPSLPENKREDAETLSAAAAPAVDPSTAQHLRMERLRAELSKLEEKLKELQQESSVIFV